MICKGYLITMPYHCSSGPRLSYL